MEVLILFDIDGTLLTTDGAAKRAFHRALLDVYGTAGPIARHGFDGKTDPQIARELLRLAGLTDSGIDAGLPRLWELYLRNLARELAQPGHGSRALAGVPELVDALALRSEVCVLGLLTGNIVRGAELKLQSAGLDGRFRCGAYGSDSEFRHELPALAVGRARELCGRDFVGERVVVIGDTPADITCGQAIGVRSIGVATGRYDAAALAAAGAHAVLDDLSDTEGVIDVLLPLAVR